MIEIKKINLLVLLLTFEKFWGPFALSDSSLFLHESKAAAKKAVRLFNEIYNADKSEALSSRIMSQELIINMRKVIDALNIWSQGTERAISISGSELISGKATIYIQLVINKFEEYLSKELKLPEGLNYQEAPYEVVFFKNALKWYGQIPDMAIPEMSNEYIEKMSQTDSIVLVADIRRSQDLMTYGDSPNTYRDRIIEFMNKTRQILQNHCGIYDRFTGDGFIAYFNKHMCEQQHLDYYQMMIESCKEILLFANVFFDNWKKTLRKIPDVKIGLSIGIDSGNICYKDINNQLFAIGDACVWATRMSAAGNKGEVILNNIPFQVLNSETLDTSLYEEITSTTKSGEKFTAYKLSIDEINYLPREHGDKQNSEPGAIA